MVRRLALVGTGLIGASVGLAAKHVGVERVVGWDIDPEALRVTAERGAADDVTERLDEALEEADLAIVAVPVTALPALVKETLAGAPTACTVTDVGSTKSWSGRPSAPHSRRRAWWARPPPPRPACPARAPCAAHRARRAGRG